jgi:DNA-binding MarR family transcriptional regulator
MAPSSRTSRRDAAPAGGRAPAAQPRSPRALAQSEAIVAVLRAANRLGLDIDRLLKRSKLTLAQYNVLRILRGAGAAGAACGEVGAQLIEHDPDITRLVDRLDRQRLVERARDRADRRIVRTRITAKGLELLAALDPQVDALHERQLGHLSDRDISNLKALVEAAAGRAG